MTDYNDGNWHGWTGGECPVHPKSVVEVKLGCGLEAKRTAADYCWDAVLSPDDIIAFRVVEKHRPAREFWIVNGIISHNSEREAKEFLGKLPHGGEIIHVREVTE